MTVILKLMLFMLVTSINENKETCNSRHGKTQSDGLGCNEETKNLYQDLEQRSQEVSRSQSVGQGQHTGKNELRIVLIGKTGVGKSTTGNTILGREAFESQLSSNSVTTDVSKHQGVVDGMNVVVVDTPGLFDTQKINEDMLKNMAMSVSFSAPGPHVFLVVVKLDRFTEEEKSTLEDIERTFGPEASWFIIVVFSYREELAKSAIEEFIAKDTTGLSVFIRKCHGRYHALNNKDTENHKQVSELLVKIKEMVAVNGGGFYTNEMFKIAEEAIKKETERILKEYKEQRQKEEEELKARLKGEALKRELMKLSKKHREQARIEAERDNDFLKNLIVVGSLLAWKIYGGLKGLFSYFLF